ncbi:hypothetical protein ACWEQL_42305, partial [Kitasatospora sp. NPDC004240]
MRSARTLLAGAAVAAVLTVGAPLAYADGGTDSGKNLTWQEKQEKAASPEGQKTWEEKQAKGAPGEEGKAKDAPAEEGKAPKGGVHTGGGGLALSGGGLASGAVLLLGGLGVGAYAMRRNRR